jgi:Ca2+-binding EF-hand superfamily protein
MQKIYPRGVRGLIGLRRQFRLMDTSGDGVLQYEEFAKAISDFQIFLPDVDVRNSFKAFDINQDGTIECDEFIKVLVGPMSLIRA